MKTIGKKLMAKREEIGITIDEVSSDLQIDSLLIENLEIGNQKVFKDVIELKDTVSLYAKYLGLDDEKMLEDLDDFLFEKTSKISIEDIREKLEEEKEKYKDNKKKIRTPYTVDSEREKNVTLVVILFLILIILVIFYVFMKKIFF